MASFNLSINDKSYEVGKYEKKQETGEYHLTASYATAVAIKGSLEASGPVSAKLEEEVQQTMIPVDEHAEFFVVAATPKKLFRFIPHFTGGGELIAVANKNEIEQWYQRNGHTPAHGTLPK